MKKLTDEEVGVYYYFLRGFFIGSILSLIIRELIEKGIL